MNSKEQNDYERTRQVILSCRNLNQLKVGVKMYNQLNKMHTLPEKQLDILENLIGLMRIKCGDTSSEEKVSDIGEEFKKSIQSNGEQNLKNNVFSEEKEKKTNTPTPKELSKKHNVDIKTIQKEINIGTKIEMEHTDSKETAEKIATDHVDEFVDYYTNPEYGIIAIENKRGDKKTIRISKKEMEKLHKTGNLTVDGVNLSYKEDLKEDLDYNDITKQLRDQLKQKTSKRFSKDDIFREIKRRREIELSNRMKELEKSDEEDIEQDIEEATGASSSGSFVGPMGRTINRSFKKTKIPVSVNGINKPIGKNLAFENEKEIIEEEELDEATSVASVGGQYVSPKFWAKGKDNWRNRVKKAYPGGKFVNIKKKCKNYPYCDQGSGGPSGSPITLTDTSEMEVDGFFNESRIMKTVKKKDLKIKR